MWDEAVRVGVPRVLPGRASGRRISAAALLAVLLALPAGAAPPALDAEAMARRVYYEGVPYAAARALGDADAALLARMLRDPAEREWWPNIVVMLGIAGRPGAFEALVAAAEAGSSGEIDRPAYKLQTSIPLAMGHLARSDPRALAWLEERAREGGDPGWSFRSMRGERLVDQLRGLAVVGLGLSGRPEARSALEAIAGEGKAARGVAGSLLAAQAEEALRLHARIAAEGPDAVLAAPDRE